MKYILTDKTKEIDGHVLYQIELVEPFLGMQAGTLGGYVESRSNLADYGNCWIYDEACVYGKAFIAEDAKVVGNAKVCGDAFVHGNAEISGNAVIDGAVHVRGSAEIGENAKVKPEKNGAISLSGCAVIKKDAYLKTYKDYIVFENCIWLNGFCADAITFYKTATGDIGISFSYDSSLSEELLNSNLVFFAEEQMQWYELAMKMAKLQMFD